MKKILPLALLALSSAFAATITFSNTTSVTIPGTGTGATTGSPATPFPSDITVSGISGPVTSLTISLFGLTHTFPDDVDFLVVSPKGAAMIILSDAGDTNDWVQTNLVIDDNAANAFSDTGSNQSGTYRPSNFGTIQDLFPAPAPAGPYSSPAPGGVATLLSVLGAGNPNGTWSLYIVDDAAVDVGTMSGGWAITLSDDSLATGVPEPATVWTLGLALAGLGVAARRRR